MARLNSLTCLIGLVPFLLLACSGASPSGPELPNQAVVAQEKIRRGAVLIDVRSPEDYQLGHIAGARNIPIEELTNRVHEIGGNRLQAIVVYSDDDKKSNLALNTLYSMGYENVLNAGAYESLSQEIGQN